MLHGGPPRWCFAWGRVVGVSLGSWWCGGLAGGCLARWRGRCLTCFNGGQVFDVALVRRSGSLVFPAAPLGRRRSVSVSRPTGVQAWL